MSKAKLKKELQALSNSRSTCHCRPDALLCGATWLFRFIGAMVTLFRPNKHASVTFFQTNNRGVATLFQANMLRQFYYRRNYYHSDKVVNNLLDNQIQLGYFPENRELCGGS